uniref:ShKT domain-containing protein n=1 Tax=Ditylenchus dipsaci TaxID=166011 RepID=A0A915D283_9BILA
MSLLKTKRRQLGVQIQFTFSIDLGEKSSVGRQSTFTFGSFVFQILVILSQLQLPTVGQSTNPVINSKIPPSIYKWIEENAHICTIVPVNGESLVNFLSADEGAKCSLCAEMSTKEVPKMACAVEVSPNEIDVDIGCHPVPELCVLELRNRYADFYKSAKGVAKPSSEEEIFHASGNPFAEISKSNHLAEIFTSTTTQATTTMRADSFSLANPGVAIDINLTEISKRPRLSVPGLGRAAVHRPSENQENAVEINVTTEIESMEKRNGPTDDFSKESVCKDTHELCCFWATAGECDRNPFWMRVNCAKTCGTCNCTVRNANRCVSTGMECETTTTSTTTTTTTPSTTTTPTMPPTTTTRLAVPSQFGRKRPGSRAPGHRPQRPQSTNFKESVGSKNANDYYADEVNEYAGDGDSSSSSNSFEGSIQTSNPNKKKQTTTSTPSPPFPTTEEQSSSTTFVSTSTTQKQTCFNYHRLCQFWTELGECEKNPFWMRPHCQKACQSCGEALQDVFAPKELKPDCSNLHTLCPFWSFIGECAQNPRWMSANCKATLLAAMNVSNEAREPMDGKPVPSSKNSE